MRELEQIKERLKHIAELWRIAVKNPKWEPRLRGQVMTLLWVLDPSATWEEIDARTEQMAQEWRAHPRLETEGGEEGDQTN